MQMADSQAQRYSTPELPGLQFTRRPVHILPEEGTMGVVDSGTIKRADAYVGAIFRDGHWVKINGKDLRLQPTFWTSWQFKHD